MLRYYKDIKEHAQVPGRQESRCQYSPALLLVMFFIDTTAMINFPTSTHNITLTPRIGGNYKRPNSKVVVWGIGVVLRG